MGAWIEIKKLVDRRFFGFVAPLVGAWIEIMNNGVNYTIISVAPLVGAWIEIPLSILFALNK